MERTDRYAIIAVSAAEQGGASVVGEAEDLAEVVRIARGFGAKGQDIRVKDRVEAVTLSLKDFERFHGIPEERYTVRLTTKDGRTLTGSAEHHLLISSELFRLGKEAGTPEDVLRTEVTNTLTGLPATPEEIEAH